MREEPSLPKLVAMWWLGSDWRLGSQGPHSFHSFPQSPTPGEGRVRLEVGGSRPCMCALVSLFFFGRRGRDAGRRLGTGGHESDAFAA